MHRHSPRRALVAAATVAAAAIVALTAAPAIAAPLCSFDQLTDQPGVPTNVASSGDGATVALVAPYDLGGNPDDNREVFVVDTTTEELEQITETAAGEGGGLSVDGDGSRVAFTYSGDPVGDNADGNSELFSWDGANGVVQLTDTTGPSVTSPSISADGTRIAFASAAPIGSLNADGDAEIFLHQVGGTTTAITDHTGRTSTAPQISADGSTVVYASDHNPTLINADGNPEIFYQPIGGGVAQLTATTAVDTSSEPTVDADGSTVAFVSTAPLDGTTNLDSNPEIFLSEIGNLAFRQLTFSNEGAGPGSLDLSDAGDRLAFQSDRDLTGENPDLNVEQHLLDLADTLPVQVTDTAGSPLAESSLDASGTHLALLADIDPLGTNPGADRQLFRLDCSPIGQSFTDVATTHPFFREIGWMASAGISTGFQPGPTYQPAAAVSRGAMSAFMYRLADSPTFTAPGTPTFGDVGTGHPFYDEIEWMADEGITTGTAASPKPLYKPGSAVSRGAMSAFMYRLAGSPAFTAPGATTFGDVSGSHPFYDEIEWMADEGITTGTPASPKPLYKPSSAVSRAAMSAFMHRLASGPGVQV